MNKCTRCKVHQESTINCKLFYGNRNADYLFVLGKPYTTNSLDKDEKFLDLLSKVNLTIDDIAYTPSFKCNKYEKPTKKELDTCFINLLQEINNIDPKYIIALGETALYQLTGKSGVNNYVGKVLYSDKVNSRVFILNSLSSIKEENFLKIKNLDNINEFEVKHYKFKYINTKEKFYEILPEIKNATDVYLDIESTGLSPYKDELRTVQLGLDGKNIYIISADILPDIKYDLKILEPKNIIGQDVAFDIKWLAVKLGIYCEQLEHDTCLAEYIISGMKNNDLTYLTGKYVPESVGYDDAVYALGGAQNVKDITQLLQYGADDIGVMKPIRRAQYNKLVESGQYDFYKNILLPCNTVLTSMSLEGVKYDLDKLWELDKKYEEMSLDLLKRANRLKGVKFTEYHFKTKFNPNSSHHIKYLLLEYYKLPVLKKTKEQNPSISKTEMEIYAKSPYNNKYCQIMEQYRSYQTLRSSFLSGTVDKLINGVAHTTYSLHATTTGRPNSKEPNLLNLPSRVKEIKEIYTVKNKDNLLLYFDLSQAEVKVASVIYYDKNLIKFCNEKGKDFHCIITAKVFNMSYEEVYEKYKAEDAKICLLRDICKSITFGILYQMGAESLARDIGVTVPEAQKFIDDYFRGFPDLKRKIEERKQFVVDNGYVETYFGFRRYFKDHSWEDHETLRQAVNTPIQGTCWNLIELIMIQINNFLKKNNMVSKLILQIYDAVVLEANKKEIDILAPVIHNLIINVNKPYPILNEVNFTADIKIGKNLLDMETYKF